MNRPPAAGLYVHVPFCRTKCPYCAFYSVPSLSLLPRWLEALEREALIYRDRFVAFDSLYVGGGTPTVLSRGQWSGLMAMLREHLVLSDRAEVTVEANPDDVTPDLLRLLRDLGVNRISLGVQSFDDGELRCLQRRHTSGRAAQALESVRDAGFSNVSLDLMYGLPGQSEALWVETLRRALDFAPEHISCYQFTVEEGTPCGEMRDRGLIRPLGEVRERAMFILTSGVLEEAGYLHYEISNYARGGESVCRHNMKYWRHVPYLGLGPSAHSFEGGERWWNLASVAAYCRALDRGEAPVAGRETLSGEQLDLEVLLLGLRTREGVALEVLRGRPGAEKTLKDLTGAGLVRVAGERVVPTRDGFLVADSLPLLFSS